MTWVTIFWLRDCVVGGGGVWAGLVLVGCFLPQGGAKKREIRLFSFSFSFFLYSVFLVLFSKHEHINNQHFLPPFLGYPPVSPIHASAS